MFNNQRAQPTRPEVIGFLPRQFEQNRLRIFGPAAFGVLARAADRHQARIGIMMLDAVLQLAQSQIRKSFQQTEITPVAGAQPNPRRAGVPVQIGQGRQRPFRVTEVQQLGRDVILHPRPFLRIAGLRQVALQLL